ncbi:hypothetical protein UPYG_G00236970 [Umbra pygmaea]|uniref:Uncharacterized protein n=1 Tax=Umbra pygmaea TaxID=75934 RepID=A0ABD0WYS4_UMBPY
MPPTVQAQKTPKPPTVLVQWHAPTPMTSTVHLQKTPKPPTVHMLEVQLKLSAVIPGLILQKPGYIV